MASVDQRYLDIGSLKIDEELDTPNKVRLSYYFCSLRTLQYLLGLLLGLFYSFKIGTTPRPNRTVMICGVIAADVTR